MGFSKHEFVELPRAASVKIGRRNMDIVDLFVEALHGVPERVERRGIREFPQEDTPIPEEILHDFLRGRRCEIKLCHGCPS